LFALIQANQAYLAPWMPWAEKPEKATTVAFLRDTRRRLADNDGFETAIVDSDAIVGRRRSFTGWTGETARRASATGSPRTTRAGGS